MCGGLRRATASLGTSGRGCESCVSHSWDQGLEEETRAHGPATKTLDHESGNVGSSSRASLVDILLS